MKKQTLLFLVFIVLLFVSGCSSEPLEEAITYGDYQFKQETPIAPQSIPPPVIDSIIETGNISFNGSFSVPETSAKIPVPDCSGKIPTTLFVKIVDSLGVEEAHSLPITMITDNVFTVNGNIEKEIGAYTITEQYLIGEDATITHAVPSVDDPRFPFSSLVDNPLPSTVEIVGGVSNIQTVEALCWTAEEVEYNGSLGYDGYSEELRTALVYVTHTSCVDYLTYEVFGKDPVKLFPLEGLPFPIPMVHGISFTLTAYKNDEVVWGANEFQNYNPDNDLQAADTILVDIDNCN